MGCFDGWCGAPCLGGDSGWERCALLLDVVCGVLSVFLWMCGELVFICLCLGAQRGHEVSSSLGLLAVYPFPSLLIPSYLAGLFSGG